jgi:hypothetical protein
VPVGGSVSLSRTFLLLTVSNFELLTANFDDAPCHFWFWGAQAPRLLVSAPRRNDLSPPLAPNSYDLRAGLAIITGG